MRQAWGDVFARLSVADRESPLPAEDLQRLAVAAYLTGREQDSTEVWLRAHRMLIDRGDVPGAVRCAFWLAFVLQHQGQDAQANGWLARARRLLDERWQDCAEHGYLLMMEARRRVIDGEHAGGLALAVQAADIADRYRDMDLLAHARHVQARALILLGKVVEGMAVLDETMVAVTAGEVSAIAAGDVYCGVIEAAHETFDLRRAAEWTDALSRWCGDQPDIVAYRGECLVHRAEIRLLRGEWAAALDEVRGACARLRNGPNQWALGSAYYVRAELHRLRGEFVLAEDDYRQASDCGFPPQPGLSLLRLAQGRVEAAHTAIRRALDATDEAPWRGRLLAAGVEIMLAAGDTVAAKEAADELAATAATLDAQLLRAMGAHASGAVLLAEGETRAALRVLRRAWAGWQQLEVPYEAARVRLLIGRACEHLGDTDGARLEFDAARVVFDRLGATADAAALQAVRTPQAAGGLTPRELQVLRLVAAGKTNRGIAAELFLSEKTVARHVSNILAKLDLSSRAAATAYAYEHGVVPAR